MNEFLHSLRNQKDKRYDRNKRNYNNPQYRDQDRRGNRENWKSSAALMSSFELIARSIAETLPTIKSILENYVEQQKQSIETKERRLLAEEKQADALAEMSRYFYTMIDSKAAVASSEEPPPAMPSSIEPNPAEDNENQKAAPESIQLKREDVLGLIRKFREKEAMTFDKIAKELESMGLPTFSGKGKWRGQTVHRLYQKMTS
jgi:hypothetical protein